MTRFIELLERKISGCDALGGLEREKAVYQSVLKDYRKQLTLTDVVCSLPTEEEMISEKKISSKIATEQITEIDKLSYNLGYIRCFSWISQKCRNR